MSMEREKLESMIIDYIDGNLSDAEVKLIESELAQNESVKKLYRELKGVLSQMDESRQLLPSEALKSSFDQLLNRELAQKPEAKSVSMFPMFYRIAAGVALLMVAGVAGYWIHKDQVNQERLDRLEAELRKTKIEMMAKLDDNFSPSQRMQGISVAYEMDKPDDEIVSVLVKTMNHDPNTNVRLSALDALSKFSNEKEVRKALIEALSTQKDPVIQIALIQLMVNMKEKSVIKQLEKITKDVKTMDAVKDEAYSGIFKLS